MFRPVLAALAVAAFFTQSLAQSPPAARELPVPATPAELDDAYRTNAARADDLYTDRPVEVTGEVVRVSRSAVKTVGYDLELTTADGAKATPGGFARPAPAVVLYFTPDERGPLAALRPGQTVTARGVCAGRVSQPAQPGRPASVVRLEQCRLVEKK